MLPIVFQNPNGGEQGLTQQLTLYDCRR
jgi:hypothetical protein